MATDIERHRRDGRGLVDQHQGTGQVVPGWPSVGESALRAVADLTLTSVPIPAPTVYDVLGNLKIIGHLLPQVLDQLAEGLQRSLTTFDVFDQPDVDPADTVAVTRRRLHLAAAAALMLARELEAAQATLAHQGYRTRHQTRQDAHAAGTAAH